MRYLFLLITSVFFLSMTSFNELALPKSAWKKVEKSLKGQWPDIKIDTTDTGLVTGQGIKRIYKLQSGGSLLGYMVFADAPSRDYRFDFLVLYDPQIKILASSILVYRENYGGEIASSRWLRQFEGKNYQDNFKLDDDIVGISGATMSCRSVTNQFKHVTLKMKGLLDAGKI